MKLKDFIEIMKSDKTGLELEALKAKADNIDINNIKLSDLNTPAKETKIDMSKPIQIGDQWFMIEPDIENIKFAQWLKLEECMAQINDDDIITMYEQLPDIIAIFVRPRIRTWFHKSIIQSWDPKHYQKNVKYLLKNIDEDIALTLSLFFSMHATQCIRAILRQRVMEMNNQLEQIIN